MTDEQFQINRWLDCQREANTLRRGIQPDRVWLSKHLIALEIGAFLALAAIVLEKVLL